MTMVQFLIIIGLLANGSLLISLILSHTRYSKLADYMMPYIMVLLGTVGVSELMIVSAMISTLEGA